MPDAADHRYTSVAILLHWLIALGIIGMIGLGWYMGDLEDRAQQYALIQLHKSIGISILLLSIARLVWRLMNPAPADPPMPAWQAAAARATHIAFYVLIIAMPLSGWMLVSASTTGIPTTLFQTIPWPHLPGLPNLSDAAKDAFHGPIEFVHSKLAWVAIVLLVLHVGAALKHQFLDKDNLLARMIPGLFGKTAGPVTPARGAFAAFGAAFAIFSIAAVTPLLTTPAAPASEPQQATASEAVSLETAQNDAPETAPAPVSDDQTTISEPVSEPEIAAPAEEETATPAAEIAQPENPELAQPAPAPAPPPVPTWTVDASASSIAFTAAYMGREFSGKFDDWSADIAFDPENPETGTNIRVGIAMASVNTGEPFYDENVVLGDWFDTRTFPQAVFTADNASSLGDGRYRADGALTIRDVTRPLALDFSLDLDGDTASVETAATIQRLAFEIGSETLTEPRGDEDWVRNEVSIQIDLTAVRD